MSERSGYLGISEVLAQLRGDFPDVSVSKIRFLETEGLLTPARSPSGYRRFCAADVDRLRYILAAQRDQYLPLRVIRERLDRMGGESPASPVPNAPAPQTTVPQTTVPQTTAPQTTPGPAAPPRDADTDDTGAPHRGLLTRRELVEAAGLTDALLTELETFGLLRRIGRQYGPEALQVARTAVALTAYGVEARHLRAVRAAAERETAMIESVVAPILRQRGSGRDLAARTAGELAELVLDLHGALVDGVLAEAGLTAQARTAADLDRVVGDAGGEARHSAPGVRIDGRGSASASGVAGASA
jgi:DNA-binding transcriptional MerR regulator